MTHATKPYSSCASCRFTLVSPAVILQLWYSQRDTFNSVHCKIHIHLWGGSWDRPSQKSRPSGNRCPTATATDCTPSYTITSSSWKCRYSRRRPASATMETSNPTNLRSPHPRAVCRTAPRRTPVTMSTKITAGTNNSSIITNRPLLFHLELVVAGVFHRCLPGDILVSALYSSTTVLIVAVCCFRRCVVLTMQSADQVLQTRSPHE